MSCLLHSPSPVVLGIFPIVDLKLVRPCLLLSPGVRLTLSYPCSIFKKVDVLFRRMRCNLSTRCWDRQ